MNKLGRYTVPSTGAGTGVVDSKYMGCQVDFWNACEALKALCVTNGATLTYGTYGYVTKEVAEERNKNGVPQYLSYLNYYGWGIAMDATITTPEESTRATKNFVTAGVAWFSTALTNLGLAVIDISSTVGGRIIIPLLYTGSSGATAVSYESDYAIATTKETSASLASTMWWWVNDLPNADSQAASEGLTGERALANDSSLWSDVKSRFNTTLRKIASSPSGDFLAYYPDQWGLYNNTPYLNIEDIELLDLRITQSDASFKSHVFVTGVTQSGESIGGDWTKFALTKGVVSIESPVSALAAETVVGLTGVVSDKSVEVDASDAVSAILERLVNVTDENRWMFTPKELYRRYGARPDATRTGINIIDGESSDGTLYIMPFLYALYTFMEAWANQFSGSSVRTTFMPEMFAGGRVRVVSKDISFYVKSVTHNMSYADGFTTSAEITAPVGTLVAGLLDPKIDVSNEA